MFDPSDIDAPDIFGDLGSDAMKVVGPLALSLFVPMLLLIAAFGGLAREVSGSLVHVVTPATYRTRPPDCALPPRFARAGRCRSSIARRVRSTR